jgi:hypothetical protein
METTPKQKPEVKKKLKMKVATRTAFTTNTGISVKSVYCRRCTEFLNPRLFSTATDTYLDKNGLQSICNPCLETIFQECLASERDLERAFLKFCRITNWQYSKSAIDASLKNAEKLQKDGRPIIYVPQYKATLHGSANIISKLGTSADLTFHEPSKEDFIPNELNKDFVSQEVIDFWGDGFDPEDYAYLEKEFLGLKKSYKCDLRGDEIAFREVCWTLLEIKKARANNGIGIEALQKRLSAQMKDSAISPIQQTQGNSEKSLDSWGIWLEDFENFEPSQFFDEERIKKYLNYGDFQYYKDYYIRSLTNLVTNSRNFSLSGAQDFDETEIVGALEVNDVKETETTSPISKE